MVSLEDRDCSNCAHHKQATPSERCRPCVLGHGVNGAVFPQWREEVSLPTLEAWAALKPVVPLNWESVAVNLKAAVPITWHRLATEAKVRKGMPVFSGCLKLFPLAMAAVAELTLKSQQQHGLTGELKWDRSKSGDELDALTRHLLEAGTVDTDGIRHSAKVAWRALANLQKELEVAK